MSLLIRQKRRAKKNYGLPKKRWERFVNDLAQLPNGEADYAIRNYPIADWICELLGITENSSISNTAVDDEEGQTMAYRIQGKYFDRWYYSVLNSGRVVFIGHSSDWNLYSAKELDSRLRKAVEAGEWDKRCR